MAYFTALDIAAKFEKKPLSVVTVEFLAEDGINYSADITGAKVVPSSSRSVVHMSFNYRTGTTSHIRNLDVPAFAAFNVIPRG